MSLWSDIFGGSEEQTQNTQNDIRQLPDYGEATAARENWWDTLQSWGSQPGYGAISPNFKDIWENVKQKVNQYYWGSALEPGAISKVESNAAKRNSSDQPAMNRQIGRLQASEAQQLRDIAVEQAMQEANLGEKGRETWLNSMQNLSSLKPAYTNYGSTTNTQKTSQPGLASTALAGYDTVQQLMNPQSGASQGSAQGSVQSSEGEGSAQGSGGFNAQDLIPLVMKLLPMLGI